VLYGVLPLCMALGISPCLNFIAYSRADIVVIII
jgi:hypothetical protein